ncbi:hypothetical protein [Sedimentisphaera cyanobacteriorum]|uniref:hypothetical protein n=1 Tax=Sedimentisphaera cyanobacteriorum TaxID=1940790 RepID=UPI0009875A56|nr:hypothetical protein [Sedimentisphaera cyanobacteriorum]
MICAKSTKNSRKVKPIFIRITLGFDDFNSNEHSGPKKNSPLEALRCFRQMAESASLIPTAIYVANGL